jgi:hypothetical protein
MGVLEDFLGDQSKRLHDSYADERPAEPHAGFEPEPTIDEAPPTPEEMAAAEKYVLRRVLNPITVALVMLDDDPHVQQFCCGQGHFLGSVSLLQIVVVLRVGDKAQCVICGERCKVPAYKPLGDEPEYILKALKEKTDGQAPEAE